ncbi:hypothetical protein NUU61_002555 [Penicillium alfredii]|uniref:Uncharacterized protein n=1 Tax=Penicillium alfredii TaxID=1506179 RepID=A0A9W9KH00_9EURO|nr:uncharacterized protein NUU61_002555 [Penicillium alfredii]KAJ5105208.1 hypothetical protein NUU61_002555 [Penicillium alfredii]
MSQPNANRRAMQANLELNESNESGSHWGRNRSPTSTSKSTRTTSSPHFSFSTRAASSHHSHIRLTHTHGHCTSSPGSWSIWKRHIERTAHACSPQSELAKAIRAGRGVP